MPGLLQSFAQRERNFLMLQLFRLFVQAGRVLVDLVLSVGASEVLLARLQLFTSALGSVQFLNSGSLNRHRQLTDELFNVFTGGACFRRIVTVFGSVSDSKFPIFDILSTDWNSESNQNCTWKYTKRQLQWGHENRYRFAEVTAIYRP